MTNNDQTDDIYALASAEQTISPRADSDRKRRLAGTEFDREVVNRIYERWAPIYDFVFGPLFDRGRQAAIDATARIGGRILDVGVGTGIALPQYGGAASVVGANLSLGMLRKAQERVTGLGLQNVEGLAVMDAERLAFPDAAFDVVVAQYVVNTVPNPEATLDEFTRVLKPGGEMVLLNRVGAESGLRACEKTRNFPALSIESR